MASLFAWLTFGSTLSLLGASWAIPVLVFVGTAAVSWLTAGALVRRPRREESRLRRIAPQKLEETAGEGLFGSLTPALAAQIPESEKEQRDFQLLLRQAGLYGPAARSTIYALRFVLLILPLVAAGVWAVMAERPQTWKIVGIGLMAAAVLSIIPRLYVYFRRRRRMVRIRQALPDTLDMLSMCTSGGLGLSESLDHVASQLTSHPELAQELTILKRQAEVGSLKHALADFAIRVDLPEVRQLSNLLTRGSRLGIELSGSLNEQADHLRTARRQAAMAQANKTPVKLVLPILFCFAPAALILLTAPAILELRDFLVPSQPTEMQLGEAFGTHAIVETLQDLDQSADVPLIGQPEGLQEPGR